MGAHTQEDRSTDEVGRFLSLVRFEIKGESGRIGDEFYPYTYRIEPLVVRVPGGGFKTQICSHILPICDPNIKTKSVTPIQLGPKIP